MGRGSNLSCTYVQFILTNSLYATRFCWDVNVRLSAVRHLYGIRSMQVKEALFGEQAV